LATIHKSLNGYNNYVFNGKGEGKRERGKRKREMIQFGLYNGRSLTIPSMFYIKEQVLNQDAE
jgi:hypothetical protein